MENKTLIGLVGKDLFQGILAKYDLKKFTEDDMIYLESMFNIVKSFDLHSKLHAPYTQVRSEMQDVCELLLLLRHGNNIKISADTKEGTKTIEVNSELKKEYQEMVETYLCERYWCERSMLEDSFLQDQVDMEIQIEAREKELKGRNNSYIPKIGGKVSALLRVYEPQLSKLPNSSHQYRMIGDFLCYNNKVPSCSPEEWEVLSKKEQRRKVQSWIDSGSSKKEKKLIFHISRNDLNSLHHALIRILDYRLLDK